jgi:hypothetical protein
VTLPAAGPTSLGLVRVLLDMGEAEAAADPTLGDVVAAVNSVVREFPIALRADGAEDWTAPECARVVRGATMLAARIKRREDTPDGVATFGAEGPFYIQRNDPDVALLLQLGSNAKPSVC